jgi:hypothetical protein
MTGGATTASVAAGRRPGLKAANFLEFINRSTTDAFAAVFELASEFSSFLFR